MKKINFSRMDTKAVERLARLNREKSIKEEKEIKESEKTGKSPEHKSQRQTDHEDAKAQKLFNEMKEREF